MLKEIQVAMIGTGYVGLVSGTCFAEIGHHVTCIDNDNHKIDLLCRGEIPIYEPTLKELVQKHLSQSQLKFTTDKAAVKNCDIIFIAVGTPPCSETGRADLRFIEKVASELAPLLDKYKVIVIKSTVPVGTCRRIANIISNINPAAKFDVVSNPEFLREGSAVYDFMSPDRIVVGTESSKARAMMEIIYQPFVRKNIPIVYTDIETSEMIKYTANCFLATKIAFVNEIALVCEKLGANVENVMQGVGMDPRIGAQYLQTGPGYGGSCFPKDTLALSQIAEEVGSPLKIVEAVIAANEHHKQKMVEKIIKACDKISGKTLCILGLAFKANTDDVRDSAALTIIQALQAEGAHIVAFDPAAMEKAADILSNVRWAVDVYDAVKNVDAVVVVTEWQIFRDLDLNRLKASFNAHTLQPTLIDLRNLFDPKEVYQAGIRYVPIGKRAHVLTHAALSNPLSSELTSENL